SLPSRAGAIVPAWIGVGSVKPFLARFACKTGERGNSIKVFIQNVRKGISEPTKKTGRTEGVADNFQLQIHCSTPDLQNHHCAVISCTGDRALSFPVRSIADT